MRWGAAKAKAGRAASMVEVRLPSLAEVYKLASNAANRRLCNI
jgi:hypothetical protein